MANPAHRTDTPAGAWQEGILRGQALWPSDRVTLAAASMVIREHRGSNDSVSPSSLLTLGYIGLAPHSHKVPQHPGASSTCLQPGSPLLLQGYSHSVLSLPTRS